MSKFNKGDKVKLPETKRGKISGEDFQYYKNEMFDYKLDYLIIESTSSPNNIGVGRGDDKFLSTNSFHESDLELYDEFEKTKEPNLFTLTPPQILSESCEITFTQDNDCTDPSNSGQFLKIRTDNGGTEPGDDFFILETERWAFDNIDEMILLLQTFKSKYEKWKS